MKVFDRGPWTVVMVTPPCPCAISSRDGISTNDVELLACSNLLLLTMSASTVPNIPGPLAFGDNLQGSGMLLDKE